MKVISSNHNEDRHKFPWTVRDEKENVLHKCKYVHAVNVRFTNSRSQSIEWGFGCMIVGLAENALFDGYSNTPVPGDSTLQFKGTHFTDNDGERVDRVNELILSSDGKMFHVPYIPIWKRILLSCKGLFSKTKPTIDQTTLT